MAIYCAAASWSDVLAVRARSGSMIEDNQAGIHQVAFSLLGLRPADN
ncbi:MAG: hypothetical protein P8I91_02540 [Phycisphaerales bacterium]|nr:hypothetical protein [Phycisphaerales bacterium]